MPILCVSAAAGRQELGAGQWEQGPHLATGIQSLPHTVRWSLLQDTCYGPSVSSAWGQPYAHSLGSPAHLPTSPSPTQQPSGQAGQLVCVPLLRPASLDIPSCLGSCCASSPAPGIPVQRRKEGIVGQLAALDCCQVVLLYDPLLPNLQGWGLPSMAGYLAGCTAALGLG